MRNFPFPSVFPRLSRGVWLLLLLALSGCAALQGGRPPGTKSSEDLPQSAAAPALASAASPATAAPVAEPSRAYLGTGNFVNQKATAPPAPSGPEEFALNFEDSDIRQIVQYILGDYLKESFTIHPSTSGKATIRTSKPVSKQELLPLLEGMLRDVGQVHAVEYDGEPTDVSR